MTWVVDFVSEFEAEVREMSVAVRKELAATAGVLEQFGPETGRPWVDTLNGSKHANMKELRFDADDGVWRVAFAFDTERQAILLVAGDKSGQSERKFYKALIATADKRFDAHLDLVKKAKEAKEKGQKFKEKENKKKKSKNKRKSKSKN